MNESQIISALLDKGLTGGLLTLAVWYVAKKLASQYEARIAALEEASKACEADRIFLRNLFLPRTRTDNTSQLPPRPEDEK